VESHISKALAFQVRSLREKEGWSQQRLAERICSNQNAIYRSENPNYGKQTLTTLKKIAAAFDVALVVRFVPFSELVDWVSGTPRIINGLTNAALAVPNFECEEREHGSGQTASYNIRPGAEGSAIQPLDRTAQAESIALMGSLTLPPPTFASSGAIHTAGLR
jgi:transcriptional regulator with XRE-family HTH domain